VGRVGAERYCLLIAKDGVIVSETYYKNTSESTYESDSLGKTITASLLGVAVQHGLLDLDTPLVQYGVRPRGNWSVSGTDYFPEVTMRHLLTQSSGYGTIPPGSRMTYDSDAYIQHISYAISDILERRTESAWAGALDFASTEFATALGIPDLYMFDQVGKEISSGGGQMVSCRDVARVGQLVLNGGQWIDVDGAPYQLGSAEYYKQMLEPAYPGRIDAYGFLTWLNTDVRTPTLDGKNRSNCCAPRWVNPGDPLVCRDGECGICCIATESYNLSRVPCDVHLGVLPEVGPAADESCSLKPSAKCAAYSDASEYLSSTNLGDSFPDQDKPTAFPGMVAIGMGQYAKYMYIVPEKNLTVVTLGNSWGTSAGCSGIPSATLPDGYDDGFTMSLVWNALAPAILAATPGKPLSARPVRAASFQGVARPQGDRTRHSMRADAEAHALRLRALSEGAASDTAHALKLGSCTCTCPPSQGFGKCFERRTASLPPSDGTCPSDVLAGLPPASDFCPVVVQNVQCSPADIGKSVCAFAAKAAETGEGPSHSNCTMVPGAKHLATANCPIPVGQHWDSCSWQAFPCVYSPYFPP
jgi:CubicO group peptidase (beta-lactamase class C family)